MLNGFTFAFKKCHIRNCTQHKHTHTHTNTHCAGKFYSSHLLTATTCIYLLWVCERVCQCAVQFAQISELGCSKQPAKDGYIVLPLAHISLWGIYFVVLYMLAAFHEFQVSTFNSHCLLLVLGSGILRRLPFSPGGAHISQWLLLLLLCVAHNLIHKVNYSVAVYIGILSRFQEFFSIRYTKVCARARTQAREQVLWKFVWLGLRFRSAIIAQSKLHLLVGWHTNLNSK